MSLTNLKSSQTLTNAALAGSLAALIAWAGPPGTDFPAHVFQLHVYLQHGFALWTNYWYAGRYTFVGYSLIYYPLAALVGIRLLAVSASQPRPRRSRSSSARPGVSRPSGRPGSSRSSPQPRSSGRLPLRPRAGLRIDRAGRGRAPQVALFGVLAALTWRRARSRFSSCSSSSPPPPSPVRGTGDLQPAIVSASICVFAARADAALPRSGALPVPGGRACHGARLLRARRRAHLAGRERAPPQRAVHRLRCSLHRLVRDPVEPRRQRRAPAVRRRPDRDPRLLAPPLAADAARPCSRSRSPRW